MTDKKVIEMDHPWLKFYDKTVEPSLSYPEIPVYSLLDDTARKYPLQPVTRFMGKQIIISFIADYLPFPLNIVQKFREAKLVKEAQREADIELLPMQSLIQKPAPVTFKPSASDPRQLAVLIYSGGTTGVSKGIMLSHYSIVANAHQIVAWGGLTKEDSILAVLPLFHGFGMSVCMNSSVLAGMEIVLLPKFDARDMAKTIDKYRPTLAAAVPTILVALSNLANVDKYDFTSLKTVWVGAAPLTDGIKNTFEEKTGGRTIEGYGLTEAVTAIMANPYKGKHKTGSIGLPFSDVRARIISLDGNHELPFGELGEIILQTPKP